MIVEYCVLFPLKQKKRKIQTGAINFESKDITLAQLRDLFPWEGVFHFRAQVQNYKEIHPIYCHLSLEFELRFI